MDKPNHRLSKFNTIIQAGMVWASGWRLALGE